MISVDGLIVILILCIIFCCVFLVLIIQNTKKTPKPKKMDESKSDKLKIKELKVDVPKSDESKIKGSVSEKESKDIDDIYFYDKRVETWECGYCGCENPMSVDICSACGEGGRD